MTIAMLFLTIAKEHGFNIFFLLLGVFAPAPTVQPANIMGGNMLTAHMIDVDRVRFTGSGRLATWSDGSVAIHLIGSTVLVPQQVIASSDNIRCGNYRADDIVCRPVLSQLSPNATYWFEFDYQLLRPDCSIAFMQNVVTARYDYEICPQDENS